MTNVRLEVRDDSGNLTEVLSATFTEEELARLRQFVNLMARVCSCTLVQRGMPGIKNIKWSASAGLAFECEPYRDAELYELLHVLRPVMLQGEACSFYNVLALLSRRFKSRGFRSYARTLRTEFEHGELRMYMQFYVGEQPLFDGGLIRDWLNGTQYHTDVERASNWQAIEESLSSENARALLIAQLRSRVNALLMLNYISELVITASTDQ